MPRYLTAAFFARAGRVPANLLAVLLFVVLGFVHPAFWIGGAILELLFLLVLATNARFRTAVDAERLTDPDNLAEKRLQLIASLPQQEQRRFSGLLLRFERLEEIFRQQQAEDWIMDINRDVLRRLEWAYLKLLVAQANIDYIGASSENEDTLRASISALQAEANPAGAPALSESRDATLAILKERLANVRRRAESLDEIHTDLNRIEAQVDLMIENATLQARPEALCANLELATNFAGGALFGDAESAVADLDQSFAAPPRPAARATEKS